MSSKRGLNASLVVLCIGTIFYLTSGLWSSFPYFELTTILIAVHGLAALLTSRANLFFLFRYFLVWILIVGTSLIWAIYDGEVNVAPFGVIYQTYENTRILVFAGLLSLCGSLAGWHVASLGFRRFTFPDFTLTKKHRKSFKIVGAGLAIGFGLLYLYMAGGAISDTVTYGSNTRDFGFTFGVYNVFHFIGISLLLMAGILRDKIRPLFLWLSIITLVSGMAAGSRADYLPQTFILFMLFFNNKIRLILEQKQYTKIIRWLIYGILLLLAGIITATFIAFWRIGIKITDVVSIIGGYGLFINEIFGHKMLYLETGNMMLGGLYAAIVNARENITGFLFGKSYLNYILIAPPGFLGLPRPLGLEWATNIMGVPMSLGGIFEVAEAYWNFGLLGCLFVSFFISWSFAWLLQKGLRMNNYFLLTWYMVFGFMSFRAVWYQNFSYFRITTVMLLIYLAAKILFEWFVAGKKSDAGRIAKKPTTPSAISEI